MKKKRVIRTIAPQVIHVRDASDPSRSSCGVDYVPPEVCPGCLARSESRTLVHLSSPRSVGRSLCGQPLRSTDGAPLVSFLSIGRYRDASSDPDSCVRPCPFCVANLDRMSSRAPQDARPLRSRAELDVDDLDEVAPRRGDARSVRRRSG